MAGRRTPWPTTSSSLTHPQEAPLRSTLMVSSWYRGPESGVCLVELAGLEPATPCLQKRRKLSDTVAHLGCGHERVCWDRVLSDGVVVRLSGQTGRWPARTRKTRTLRSLPGDHADPGLMSPRHPSCLRGRGVRRIRGPCVV